MGIFRGETLGMPLPTDCKALHPATSAPRHNAVIAAEIERPSAKIAINCEIEFILMSFLCFLDELHTELLGLRGGRVGAHAAGAAALKRGELAPVCSLSSFIYLFCIYLDRKFLKRKADSSFGRRSPRSAAAWQWRCAHVCRFCAFRRTLLESESQLK